jgi:hypothetical protein
MAITRLATYTCYILADDSQRQFPTRQAALDFAAATVGNRSYAKPIPAEDTYLFGPGDGTTSIMVRQDVEFVDDVEEKEQAS